MEENHQTREDFHNIPKGFQLCFLQNCPRKEECLRFMAGNHLAESRDWGPAIYPNMKITDKGCRMFMAGEPTMMAWGFDTLFSEVKSKDEQSLRTAMKQYLRGTSNFYRYQHGQKMLTIAQQQWIIDLFKRTGYTENLVFDHYAKVYNFG